MCEICIFLLFTIFQNLRLIEATSDGCSDCQKIWEEISSVWCGLKKSCNTTFCLRQKLERFKIYKQKSFSPDCLLKPYMIAENRDSSSLTLVMYTKNVTFWAPFERLPTAFWAPFECILSAFWAPFERFGGAFWARCEPCVMGSWMDVSRHSTRIQVRDKGTGWKNWSMDVADWSVP